MNKKVLLFCSTLLTAAISIGTSSAFASATNNRYSGSTRYDTCSSIVSNGWSSSEYAVLATGQDFPDSLSAVTLARLYKAPVLLTEKDKLTAVTDAQIKRLKVKTIYISGGTGVVSSAIETQLKNRGINVIRFGGQDRYETAVKIANKIPLNAAGEIAITYGGNFADALSIAPIAAKKGIPLLVVPKTLTNGKLPSSVQAYLDANKSKIKKTYVLGGSDYISSEVSAKFPNADKVDDLSADKNCDKNAAIIKRFAQDIDFSTVYIATGKDFPDTLAGAALAAVKGSPIVFINDNQSSSINVNIKSLLAGNSNAIKSIIALGGTGVVTQSDMDGAVNALQDDSSDLEVTGIE